MNFILRMKEFMWNKPSALSFVIRQKARTKAQGNSKGGRALPLLASDAVIFARSTSEKTAGACMADSFFRFCHKLKKFCHKLDVNSNNKRTEEL